MIKNNEFLKIENLEKNLLITKLKGEKFLLFNELNELIFSLKFVDMKTLNNYYKLLLSEKKLNKEVMPSSLGIKYNVLSVENQLSYILHSDLNAIKNSSEHYQKSKIDTNLNLHKKPCLSEVNPKTDKINDNEAFIDLDKYINIVKMFENEFEKVCDRNLMKNDRNAD